MPVRDHLLHWIERVLAHLRRWATPREIPAPPFGRVGRGRLRPGLVEPVEQALPLRRPVVSAALPRPERPAGGPPELPWGDFSGADEAERFAALPSIRADELDEVDWDALARALTRQG